jgi:hypothetical protein
MYFIKVYRKYDAGTGLYVPYRKTWCEMDNNGNLIFKWKEYSNES